MKTIIISGGSDGLGYATAKLLSKDNNVYILARNKERLEKASNELKCKFRVCDVSKWEEVDKTIASILTETDKIDILINNAGIWIQGAIEEINPQKIKETFEINTLGSIYMIKAVTPTMKKQGSGVILNVISQGGLIAAAERGVYYASKWAMTGFTKSIYLELIKSNIKVMGFYPGGMDTEFFEKAGNPKDKNKMLDVTQAAKTIVFMLNQGEFTVFSEVGIISSKC